MSLTASAATAVWTVLADDPGDGSERRWEDQTKEQRDLYTQFVISCALGLGAFLSFCVRLWFLGFPCCLIANPSSWTGLATQMDGALCCTETTTMRGLAATGTAGQLLWLDTSVAPNH